MATATEFWSEWSNFSSRGLTYDTYQKKKDIYTLLPVTNQSRFHILSHDTSPRPKYDQPYHIPGLYELLTKI